MIKTDECCSIHRYLTDQKRGQFSFAGKEGKASYIFIPLSDAINGRNKQSDDGKHNFYFPLNISNYQTLKIPQKIWAQNLKKGRGVPLGFSISLTFFCFWNLRLLKIGSD